MATLSANMHHGGFDIGGLFANISSTFNKAIDNVAKKIVEHKVNSVSREIFGLKAEIENFREYIEAYHINDVIADEKVLKDYFIFFDEMKDKVEELIEDAKFKELPMPYARVIENALNELYEELVALEFDISYKIAESYSDDKSVQDLLPTI